MKRNWLSLVCWSSLAFVSTPVYLAVIGDGLFVLLDDVLWTQTVLGSTDLAAGVSADGATGGQSTCRKKHTHRERVRDEEKREQELTRHKDGKRDNERYNTQKRRTQ